MPNQFTSRRPAIHVIGPSIAYIDLRNGHYALIDSDDAPLIDKWCWKPIFPSKNKNWYACRNHRVSREKQICMFMHAFLLPGDQKRDHINGNGWDNRRANLRFASNSQNAINSRIRSDNTSGFKGVHWDSQRGKWAARLYADGRQIDFGRFSSIEQAVAAYKSGAEKFHGVFARNAPPPGH